MFITTFTRAQHLSLFWARSIQSIQPLPNSWWSILILSSDLRPGFQMTHSLRFPHQTPVYTSPLPIHATCPDNLFSILTPKKYLVSSTGHYTPHYVVFSTPLYLVPLKPKYPPQHPMFKHPDRSFFAKSDRPIFTPTKQQAKLQFLISQYLHSTKYTCPTIIFYTTIISAVCPDDCHSQNISLRMKF